MKEFVRWAIVGKDGGFVASFPTKESAECSLYNKNFCTIVKLSGQIPEPKKVASYLYINDSGSVFQANQLITEDAAKQDCEKYNVKLLQWPYGSVIEVEGK
jgi:hypothetical protein